MSVWNDTMVQGAAVFATMFPLWVGIAVLAFAKSPLTTDAEIYTASKVAAFRVKVAFICSVIAGLGVWLIG